MTDRRRMLAVSLGAKTTREALDVLPEIAEQADIVELRLDFFEEPYDLERLLTDLPLPAIVTNRPPREGGRCRWPEDERLAALVRAAELGAPFVDVEWDAASPDLLASLRRNGAEIVISRHSFDGVPDDFPSWYDQLADLGADVVKIVGMAHEARDVLPVLGVLDRATLPTIAIAMGVAGLPSRVLALRSDACFLTYATLGQGERVAPGQLPIAEMREVYGAQLLNRSTRVYGLIAPTIDLEVSACFNRQFRDLGMNAVAVPVPVVTDLSATIEAYRRIPVSGWLVRDGSGTADMLVDRAGAFVRTQVNDDAGAFQAWTSATDLERSG